MRKSVHTRDYAALLELLIDVRRAELAQAELGQRLPFEQPAIGKIERGERRVDVIELKMICDRLLTKRRLPHHSGMSICFFTGSKAAVNTAMVSRATCWLSLTAASTPSLISRCCSNARPHLVMRFAGEERMRRRFRPASCSPRCPATCSCSRRDHSVTFHSGTRPDSR